MPCDFTTKSVYALKRFTLCATAPARRSFGVLAVPRHPPQVLLPALLLGLIRGTKGVAKVAVLLADLRAAP